MPGSTGGRGRHHQASLGPNTVTTPSDGHLIDRAADVLQEHPHNIIEFMFEIMGA